MSTIIDDLRDGGMHPLCDLAADEIEGLEKSYSLLFKENENLRRLVQLIFESTIPYNDAGECVFSDKVTDMWCKLCPAGEVPEIFPGTLEALNSLVTPNVELSGAAASSPRPTRTQG